METKVFKVPDIGCDACVTKIKAEIGQLTGVIRVDGDTRTKVISIQWDTPATWELIKNRLIEMDYPIVEM